jgi:hypothetical protein
LPKTLGARTPKQRSITLGLTGLLLSLLVFTLRTTPGLVLITLGAATAYTGHPWTGLAAAVVGALVYREQCYRTPYAPCIACRGIGYRPHRHTRRRGHGKTGRRGLPGLRRSTARRCRLCGGKGVRIRWGRAAMNAYRRATYTPRETPDPATSADVAPAAGPPKWTDAVRRHATRNPTHR